MRNQPLFIALILGICLFQHMKISRLQGDLALFKKNVDSTMDLLEEKKTSLQQCDDSNYELSEKIKYVEGQNDYMVERCTAIYNRLRETTSILESVEYCANHRMKPVQCGVTNDLSYFLDTNRKAKF